jgi:ADP-ribosylglycohydrolase
MSDRERDETGQFRETVTLDDVLGVFDEVRGPVITSSDVAEALDCTTEAARQKLTRLYDQGEVDRRKTGRTTVWWHTGDERITPGERGDRHAESARDRREQRAEEPVDRSDSTPSTGEESIDDLEAALATLDTNDARRDAVRECINYLREHGTGQKSDFVDAVYSEHPAGYGSAGGWWNKIGKQHLKAVAEDLPALIPPPTEGAHNWRWIQGASDT